MRKPFDWKGKVGRKDVLRTKNADRPSISGEDLMIRLARHTGISREKARKVIKAMKESIIEGVARDRRLKLRGFGVFSVSTSKTPLIPGVNTKFPHYSGRRDTIRFRAAKSFLRELNER